MWHGNANILTLSNGVRLLELVPFVEMTEPQPENNTYYSTL